MKERNGTIDVARGIALFLVVLGHLVTANSITFNWIFSFHMPIFFFLSGMCFNFEKYNSFLEFAKDKFKKRIIPYFGFVILGITVCLIVPAWRAQLIEANALNVLEEIFYFTQPEKIHVGQVWFLVTLFSAEIILYVLNKLFEKFKINKYLIIITYVILALLGSKILDIINMFNLVRLPFKIDTALTASVLMELGYQANKTKIFEQFKEYKIAYIMIFLCLGFLIGKFNGYVNICDCIYSNIILYYISAICGIAGIYLISETICQNKLLQFYGKNSLFMFAIHSLLIAFFAYITNMLLNKEYVPLVSMPFYLSIMGSIIVFAILLPITIG